MSYEAEALKMFALYYSVVTNLKQHPDCYCLRIIQVSMRFPQHVDGNNDVAFEWFCAR